MAVMLPNCPQAVISYYGTLLAGGIVVQTNPLYTEYELEYQLNDSGASVLVTMDLLYPKTEKFHEQFLLSTRDENGHSKGAHFHGKVPWAMVCPPPGHENPPFLPIMKNRRKQFNRTLYLMVAWTLYGKVFESTGCTTHCPPFPVIEER
ncbi:hypothetical protein JCM14450A_30730 [Geobacillus stearothermophilus]